MDAGVESDASVPQAGDFLFLSYSRTDEKIATIVREILEQAGYRVWWDGLIPGGDRFGPITSDALEKSRAVVVLWSQTSIASHWVHDEATRGRDRGCLVPLSIDGSEPPLGFRQFQYIDVSREGLRPPGPQMQRALRSLATLFAREHIETPVAQPKRVLSRRAMLGTSVGLIVAGAAGFGGWRFLTSPAASSGNSIAVLPFENLSGDKAQQYFSDGLAAELRAQLSRNPMLSVMGQASSNEFRAQKDDGRAIAGKLNVAYLLDGNVRVAEGAVRIAIELIDGVTGFSKWSDSFDRPLTNIFKVQQEIAEAVDSALAVKLGAKETAKASSGGTENVGAFDAFLRGRNLFESQRDERSDRDALARFEEAIRLDPTYAAAHAARSRALAVIANQYGQVAERRQLYQQSVDEAREAVRLAPEFADGFAALGYALFYGSLDVAAAEEPYDQASKFGQGSADVLSRYALYRARRKQDGKAEPAIARAVTLDPLNPSVFKTQGLINFAKRDYAGAIASARRALAINPLRATLHGDIGNALLMLGRIDEAAAEFGQEKSGLLALPGQAFVGKRRGDEAAITTAYQALVGQYGDNGFYQQAQMLAQWGKTAQALDALDKARAEQDAGLVSMFIDPFLDPLRSDARFKALLAQLHFV